MRSFFIKSKFFFLFFLAAVLIGTSIILYTNNLVREISAQERNRIAIWSASVHELSEINTNEQVNAVLYRIIEENTSIPVILTDENGSIIAYRNLPKDVQTSEERKKYLQKMRKKQDPIVVKYSRKKQHYIYYEDSLLLKKIAYYPYVQLFIASLFVFVSFLVFRISRRAETNQLWAGLSKETAHQLGTPISSLLAWVELLKAKEGDSKLTHEVSKDVQRLEQITERFAGIGAQPVLLPTSLYDSIQESLIYLKSRTSARIEYSLDFKAEHDLLLPLNNLLFGWVIENLCKNAIDAMQGVGRISIVCEKRKGKVLVDISDTGKGIKKSMQRRVFKPGYTTKKRGWGLGLSLVKRIIESYHSGKIFVKSSEIGKGTTFRIVLYIK
ncbi:MAG: ATP-binding protein [Bacteroidia bacterium]|nr:MAG: ATP-binding protein [Bacteroidia bacterium]